MKTIYYKGRETGRKNRRERRRVRKKEAGGKFL